MKSAIFFGNVYKEIRVTVAWQRFDFDIFYCSIDQSKSKLIMASQKRRVRVYQMPLFQVPLIGAKVVNQQKKC